jgi:protein TonB
MIAERQAPINVAFPGHAVQITIEPAAVLDIMKHNASGQTPCGLLIGPAPASEGPGPKVLCVEMYLALNWEPGTPLAAAVRAVAEILDAWSELPNYPKPLGLYVGVPATSARPFAGDLPKLRNYLKDSPAFLITADPNGGAYAEVFLTREDKGSWPRTTIEWPGEEMPRVAQTNGRPPAPPQRFPDAAAGVPPAARPAPPAVPPKKTMAPMPLLRSRAVPGWAMGAIAGALLAGGIVWWNFYGTGVGLPNQPAADRTTFVAPPVSAIRFNVARSGGDLQIEWDRNAELIRTARQGLLYIDDGAQRTRLFLETGQLTSGRVLYSPRTSDVEIRLEIMTPDDRVIRESIRILQGGAKSDSTERNAIRAEQERRPESRTTTAARAEEPEIVEETVRRQFVPPPVRPPSLPAGTAQFASAPDVKPLSSSAPAVPVQTVAAIRPPVEAVKQMPAQTPPAQTAVAKPPVIVPPKALRQSPALVPRPIRQVMTQDVLIEVKLSLDERGSIVGASAPPQPDPLRSHLAKIALDAARAWKFSPASRDGKGVPSEFVISFRFQRAGT